MKRLIIAVCMLITGIAISIGGYVNLKSICRNMSCSVNEVIRAAENGDADETKRKCDDTGKNVGIKKVRCSAFTPITAKWMSL